VARANFSLPVRRCAGVAVVISVLLAAAGCSVKSAKVPQSRDQVVLSNALTREGDEAFLNGEHYHALIHYLEAGRVNPGSPYVQNKVGLAYAGLNYFDDAERAFERATRIHPRFASAYNNLGSIHLAQGEYREAEKQFKTAIRLNPNVASYHLSLAFVCFERGKGSEGLGLWKKAVSLDPDVMTGPDCVTLPAASGREAASTNYYLARLYASTGDIERCLEKLKEALDGGFSDVDSLTREPDFERVRQDPRFQEIVKTARQMHR
jgi:tetratricopeptide (TPR) repeat protein